ncbi:hypothetical protein CRENBAI_017240 [Crenichthys baileyi]|uniref:Uncharacterized protein n=1 Tax=Crenichthys baileyi TaxID=28760 RepID=A0AAV9QUQ8_9TELE
MPCQSTFLSPLVLPFTPMFRFGPVPLADPLFPPHSPTTLHKWSFPFLFRSRRSSIPLYPTRRPLLLSRHLSMPASFVRCGKSDAACGVNCHKACRSRLAVECRKRTKSISHETPPALQARSYSFPLPANSPPSLQDTVIAEEDIETVEEGVFDVHL